MPNIMMHAPAAGLPQACVVNGRSYTGLAGSPQLVPDFDAIALEANGWTHAGEGGATSARPATPKKGQTFNDTTVGTTIKWDGKTWRNATTGAAV